MKISEHFSREEFDCHDGTPYPIKFSPKLLFLCESLEVIREAFGGKQIIITSGYRTEAYNKRVKGVKNSTHIQGIAVDFKVLGVSARKVAAKVRELANDGKIPQGGVGDYPTFTHYDTRGFAARWRGK